MSGQLRCLHILSAFIESHADDSIVVEVPNRRSATYGTSLQLLLETAPQVLLLSNKNDGLWPQINCDLWELYEHKVDLHILNLLQRLIHPVRESVLRLVSRSAISIRQRQFLHILPFPLLCSRRLLIMIEYCRQIFGNWLS